MQIRLEQVIPHPLRERLNSRSSDIWGRDLTLEPGQRIQVVAPSGTGKTTLIHTLWNLRQDHDGRVWYNKEQLNGIKSETLSRYRQNQLSVVFQDLRLFPNLTAAENIELKRLMCDTPWCSAAEATAMAESLGIGHILQRRVATCSYGEQQRVAIVRALVQPFAWLVMDEPFSHLDQENTRRAAALITEACDRRGAGLLTTDLDGTQHFTTTHTYHL